MKFELGEVLKDKITGFQGVAMARTEYFTDCIHYGLCSQELKDGKPIDWEWIDETRLVQVKVKQKDHKGSTDTNKRPVSKCVANVTFGIRKKRNHGSNFNQANT